MSSDEGNFNDHPGSDLTGSILGVKRGLQRLATSNGSFCVLAIDHGSSFVGFLKGMLDREPTVDEIRAEKRRIIRHLAPISSGVVADFGVGIDLAIDEGLVPSKSAMIVGLPDVPTGWSAALGWPWQRDVILRARRDGCDGVKVCILVSGKTAGSDRVNLASEVGRECRRLGLVYVLEVVQSFDADRRRTGMGPTIVDELTLEYVNEFGRANPDIFKLHSPWSRGRADQNDEILLKACADVTAAASSPWVLLSAGVAFDRFAHELEIACKMGARGFVAGSAIWKDIFGIASAADRDMFLSDVGAARLRQLVKIVESARDGRYALRG